MGIRILVLGSKYKNIIKLHTMKYYFLILIITPLQLFCQFAEFADSYNLLTTIAGKGELDESGIIGWSAEYENGNALDAELTRPHFAMADSSGNIYIADKDAHGIRKVTSEGIISTIAGTNIAGDNGDGLGIECQLSSPNGIWVKEDGTVYILDLGNNKIKRLNANDSLETIVHDENGIALGRGLWVTESEDSIFYASASEIKLWTAENGVQTFSSGYSGLGNITMNKTGHIVATDRTANAVYLVSMDGSSKEIIAGNGNVTGRGDGSLATETALDGVRGVWFLEDNSYFVATHEGSQIWYIDTDNIIHLFLDGRDGDEYHSGDGENYRTPGFKISEPRSISVDYDGNILIVENDYGYVRKVEKEYIEEYTTSINNRNTFRSIKAFPSPTQNSLYLNINNIDNIIKIEITDVQGQIVYNDFQVTKSLDVSSLTSGFYILNVYTTSETFKLNFVKN